MISRPMISRIVLSLRSITRQLSLVLVGALMCLSLLQPAARAASVQIMANTGGTAVESVGSESLSELRAERRKEQSEASKAANTEDEASSFKEAIDEKLNLEEIVEDNVLLGNEPKGDRAATQSQSR